METKSIEGVIVAIVIIAIVLIFLRKQRRAGGIIGPV